MKRRRPGFSLRSRLLLAVFVAVALALTVASFATRASLRSYLIARVDKGLVSATESLGHGLDDRSLLDEGGNPFREIVPEGTFVQIRSKSGALEASSMVGREADPEDIPDVPATSRSGLFRTVASARDGSAPFRILTSRLRDGRSLVVGVSLTDENSTLDRLNAIEIGVALTALALAAAAGWVLVRIGLRPLRDVERTATAIANGELDRRVPGESAHTEFGRLATTFNTMLDRIEGAFSARDLKEEELRRSEERMRRFVGDASHELRTPLAAVSAYTELFTLGARQRPDDLERTMTGIRKETTRMGDLVQDLLALARMDDGHPIERRPVELVSVAADAVNAANLIDKTFTVRLTAPNPIDLLADGGRLRQVLDNLLANVRAHTPPGTRTDVTLTHTADCATIVVADNGPGMTEEQASRIFERFYRVDPSRSRRSGGAGLGLSIVEAIVRAHSGRIRVESQPGVGTSFVIELPLAADPG